MVPTGPKPRVQRMVAPGSYHGVGLVSTASSVQGVGSGLMVPNTVGLAAPSSLASLQISAPRTVTLPYTGQQGRLQV